MQRNTAGQHGLMISWIINVWTTVMNFKTL